MELITRDFQGAKIILKDYDTFEKICEAVITKYNSRNGILTIDAEFDINEHPRVTALVLGKEQVYDCTGTTRLGGVRGEVEIALYKNAGFNNRAAVRYNMTLNGLVRQIARKGEIKQVSLPANVVNISSTGVLLRVPSKALQIKDVVVFNAINKNKEYKITAQVVRAQLSEVFDREEFGCVIKEFVVK